MPLWATMKLLPQCTQPQSHGKILETLTTRTSLPPVFLSVKRGVPPSTLPPSGTKRASMMPFAGDGTCTEVWKREMETHSTFVSALINCVITNRMSHKSCNMFHLDVIHLLCTRKHLRPHFQS